jgi:hypothetical protein
MEKVITTFKQNVLIDDHRHVFAVVQSVNQQHDLTILNQFMGHHLKHLTFFDQHNQPWIKLKNHLLSKMNISDQWKLYLGEGSGSMIEYYQMYLAYLELEKYEKEHQFKYDYIIRIRTDCVITKPLIFKTYYEDDVHMIKTIQELHHCDLKTAMTIFMTSLLDQSRTKICSDVTRACYTNSMCYDNLLKSNDEFIKQLIDYINHGRYLITFRDNVVYYGPRHVFNDIHKLGIMYGELKNYDDGWWFNAECQLKSICLFHDIDIYNSYTTLEAKSLYEYKVEHYYQDHQLKINDDVFFFLQRQ